MGNAQDKPGEKVDTLDHMAITGKGKISDAEKKKIKELYGRLLHCTKKCTFFKQHSCLFSCGLCGGRRWR